jgi:hypothetical protein
VSVVATGVDINVANNVRPSWPSHALAPPQARVPVQPPATQAPRANLAVEAKSTDGDEAVIAELARRLKTENARNMERAEMPETLVRRPAHHG